MRTLLLAVDLFQATREQPPASVQTQRENQMRKVSLFDIVITMMLVGIAAWASSSHSARLFTKPLALGSATCTKITGMIDVCPLTAVATAVPVARITSGSAWTNSRA
jgi:hypothetical protein